MSQDIFSENVNIVSSMINGMTNDIGERFGIAAALAEIYRYELHKNLVAIPNGPTEGGDNATTNKASANSVSSEETKAPTA